MLVLTGAAAAAAREVDEEIDRGIGDLIIDEEETVNGDLRLNIGLLKIAGAVTGDVFLDIGELQISGPGKVNGDVHARVGMAVIDGGVSGDVEKKMGEVIVNGNVGGDLQNDMGRIEVNGAVTGDVRSGFGDVLITGQVGGNINSRGKVIDITGIVDGDVYLDSGIVDLGPEAVVNGTVSVKKGMVRENVGARAGNIIVEEELTEGQIDRWFGTSGFRPWRGIKGYTYRDDGFGHSFRFIRVLPDELWSFIPIGVIGGIYGRILHKLLTMAVLFALAALIYVLFPRAITVISEALEKEMRTIVIWGVLAFLLALPAAILLAITIIGIPLILVEILGLAVAWILGYIGLTMLLGERILAAAKARHENTIVKIMVGVALLGLISFIPILGILVSLAVMIIAVGASLYTRFGSVPPAGEQRAKEQQAEEAEVGD